MLSYFQFFFLLFSFVKRNRVVHPYTTNNITNVSNGYSGKYVPVYSYKISTNGILIKSVNLQGLTVIK